MVNAEVSKAGNESPLAVIRKFSRKVQGTGLIQTARKRRYFSRTSSKTVSKKRALKRLRRRDEYRQLLKEGKVVEAAPRRGFQGRTSSSTAPREGNAPARESTAAAPARFGEDTPIAR